MCGVDMDSLATPQPKSIAHWRLHDLRGAAATGMAELGVLQQHPPSELKGNFPKLRRRI
jgi:hypothetical protein